MSENSNAPKFDPLNPTEQEAHDMLGGYLAAGGKVDRPALASAAFEHGWRMRRNDMAGVADDDQRALARRAALSHQGEGSVDA